MATVAGGAIDKWFGGWAWQRWVAVVAGLVVLAIPSFATIWASEIASWRHSEKLLVSVIWLVAAGAVVELGLRSDDRLGRVTKEVDGWRTQTRLLAEDFILDSILLPGATFPENWEFTLYLHSQGRLYPIWPRERDLPDDVVEFDADGHGATGLAWIHPYGVVRKYGDDVHNGEHRLSKAQQLAFADYHAVVSAAVFSTRQTKLGVLSGIAREQDRYFDDTRNQAILKQAALSLGAVLSSISADGSDKVNP